MIGFLADSEESYAAQIAAALTMSVAARARMQTAARAASTRFSDAAFGVAFANVLRPIVTN